MEAQTKKEALMVKKIQNFHCQILMTLSLSQIKPSLEQAPPAILVPLTTTIIIPTLSIIIVPSCGEAVDSRGPIRTARVTEMLWACAMK